MTSTEQSRYRAAGTLAMINALLTIPWFIMTFFLAGKEGVWHKIAEAFMQCSSTGIFVFTSLTLKKYLNQIKEFHDTDRFILLLVKANIVLTAVSLAGLSVPSIAESVGTLALVLIIPLGVIQLMFGYKLQQLQSDLGGLHRPYCYLNMVTGFSLAAVILLPLGIFTGAIADIMLGTIFFQAAATGTLVDTEA
jgi:hypothetical protein